MITSKLSTPLRDQLRSEALSAIYRSRPAETIVEGRHDGLYEYMANYLSKDSPILYLEFGVADGKSMRKMVDIFNHPMSRFIGFDSFIGLPEEWLMHKRGAFSTNGQTPTIEDGRVNFVEGWFQNTVPTAIKSLSKNKKTVLVHFDADLYSSTIFLMSQLWNLFPVYYFIFDDFLHDECVAVWDFLTAFPCDISFFAQTRGGGEPPNPDQVFGRIERKPFELPDVTE